MTTRKTFLSLFAALAAIACLSTAQSALAAIAGPYTADGSTVHLWHFDGTGTNALTDNGNTPITMNSEPSSLGGTQGHAAFDGSFGTAGQINRACCGNGGSEQRGWRATGLTGTSMLGSANGAFTMEMLIDWNSPINGNFTEIFRTESTNLRARIEEAGGGQYQIAFYIPDGGSAMVVTSPGQTLDFSKWYHLGLVYDGHGSGANNARIYLTEMDASATSATLIHSATVVGTTDYDITNFELGSDSGGQSNFYIDEMRVSSTARAATDMMFSGAVPEPSSIVLAGLGLVGLVGFGLRRRKK